MALKGDNGTMKKRIAGVFFFLLILASLLLLLSSLCKSLIISKSLKSVNEGINGAFEAERISLSTSRISIEKPFLKTKDGHALFTARKIEASYSLPRLLVTRSFASALLEVRVASPEIYVTRDNQGHYNFATMPVKERVSKFDWEKALRDFRGRLEVEDGIAHFDDHFRRHFSTCMSDIHVKLEPGSRHSFNLACNAVEKRDSSSLTRLKGSGDLNFMTPRLNISMDVSDIEMCSWGNYLIHNDRLKVLGGRGDLEMMLRGSGRNLRSLYSSLFLLVTLHVQDGDLYPLCLGAPMGHLEGSADFNGNYVSIKNLQCLFEGSKVSLSGYIYDLKHPSLDLAVSMDGLDVDKLKKLPILKKNKTLRNIQSGKVCCNGHLFGALRNPVINAQIKFDRGRIFNLDVEEANFSGSYSSAGIRIDHLQSRINGGKVTGFGWIFPVGNQLLLSLSGEKAALKMKAGNGEKIDGIADFSLAILGTSSNPTVIGKAILPRLSVGSRTFGRSFADFIVSGDTLFLKEGAVSKGGGILKASGILDLEEDELNLSISARGFPISEGHGKRSVTCSLSGLMRIFGPMNAPVAYGAIVPPGNIAFGGLLLSDPYLPVAFDGSLLSIAPGRVSYNENPLRVSGDILLKAFRESPYMELSLSADRIDPALFSKSLKRAPLKGSVETRISGGPDMGFVWTGDAHLGNGKLHSSGFVTPHDKWISCLAIHDIPLDNIKFALRKSPYPIKGTIESGDALLLGNDKGLNLGYNLNFWESSFFGFPVSSFYGDMLLSSSLLTIAHSDIRGIAGRISIDGRMDLREGSYNLKGDAAALDAEYIAQNLDLSPFGLDIKREMEKAHIPPIKGLVWSSGTLRGTRNSPRFDGSVSFPDGVLGGDALSLESKFSLLHDRALFDTFSMRAGKSIYTGRGKVIYSPGLSFDMNVTAKNGDMSRIIALTPWKDLSLKGNLDGEFKIIGSAKNPAFDGSALITRASLAGQPINEIRADMSSRDNNLHLDNLLIKFPQGSISGSGGISSKGIYSLFFSSKDFPIEEISAIRQFIPVKGKADFDMKLEGSREHPQITMSFQTEDITLGKEKKGMGSGAVHWRDNQLSIDSLSFDSDMEHYFCAGQIIFPGKIPLSREDWFGREGETKPPLFDIRGEIRNAPFEGIVKTIYDDASGITGAVDGTFSLKGDLAAPGYEIDLVVKDGKVRNIPLEKAIAKLHYKDRRFHIDTIEIKTPESSIKMAGAIGTPGSGDDNQVSIDIQNIDLGLLSSFLPKPYKLGGIINMNAKVGGSLVLPDISSQIKIKKGFIGGFDFDSLEGRINAAKGVFTFEDFFAEESGSRITLKGNVPLMFDRQKIVGTAPMELRADLKAGDLDILALVLPLEGKTAGTLKGDMEISGIFPDCMMRGILSIKDGELQPSLLKKPITDLRANINFADEKIIIKNIEGKMGQGGFALGGEIDTSNARLQNLDLKLAGKDLAIFAKEYFSGKTDVDLALKGDAAKQVLHGRIVANNSTIRIPNEVMMRDEEVNERMLEEFKKSIPPYLRNLFVNVKIDLDNDNWFTFLTSSLLMKGGVTIAGRVPEVALGGEVDLYRGTLNLPFLETPFKVYQGKAYFDGQDWSPYLALEAEADVGKYRIYMDYSGKMENPHIELSSEPPMHQDAIEKMLAGTVVSNLSMYMPGGALAADAMATRLAERMLDLNLMQPIFHAIGRTFGLTDVALEYTFEGAWSIRVAKALDARDRLLLTYDRVMVSNGELHNLYGLEYRFRKGMQVRISQDDEGRSYFWLQTKYRF